MADKKSVGHAYNVDFLNVVFAASCLFLFLTSIWMIWDDYDREWKGHQRQFVLLESEVTRLNLEAAQAAVDEGRLEELRAQRAESEQTVLLNRQRVDDLESQLERVEADLYLASQNYNFQKADYDVERYAFEEVQAEHPRRRGGVASRDRRDVRALDRIGPRGREAHGRP